VKTKALKHLSKVLIVSLLTLGVGGVSTAAQLKLATIAPEGSAWMNAMRAGAKEIKARTEGRVKIKFYGGGVMGNETSVMRKIRIGQLHGGAFTAGAISKVYPDMSLYTLPFLFENAQEAAYVRESIDPLLLEGLQKKGFTSFGIAQGGFGKLMSADKMQTLDDLKGKKLWVPEDDDISFDVMRELGLSPVKLPLTDVLTGLQTQLLEIVGSSAIGAIALQWHTKIKYVLDQPLVFIYGTLVIDRRFFGKLSKADQAIVKDVFNKIYEQIDADNHLDNEKAEQALRDNGVIFDTGDAAEVAKIIAKVKSHNEKLIAKSDFSKDLYKKIQNKITEYREKNNN